LAFSDGISTEYVKPKMGETKSIKEDAVIDNELKSFVLPKLTYDDIQHYGNPHLLI